VRIRSWRGWTPVSTSARRSFPWARVLLIVGFIAILAYLLIPAYFFVSADALVQGDLVPVTPIYRARIDRLFVNCDDHVRAGQNVAVVSNFIVQSDYQQQLQQAVAAENLSQIALDQGVSAAQTDAEAAEQKYLATNADAQRLAQVFSGYDTAYKAGAIGRFEWESKRADWQAAVALAASERELWQHALEHVTRVESDNNAKLASDRTAEARVQALATRVGAESLTAPVEGYIVDCKERPENVVDAGAPIFDIYSPNRAYVLAYFDPNAIGYARIGGDVEVDVTGLSKPLDGRIQNVYPDLDKLPPQLDRFFWQHVQWSEFRPVRIALDHVPASDRAQLYFDAQARVKIRIRQAWHPFGLFGFAL
jgi:multidrug resistance efflux pump